MLMFILCVTNINKNVSYEMFIFETGSTATI